MILYAFNKPYDVLSQFRRYENAQSLADFINDDRVRVAGRLDKDSEGLLLLTDNGTLNQRITQPDNKMTKSYWVQVEGEPDEKALNALRQGVELNDGPTLPAEVQTMTAPKVWDREPPIRQRQSIPTSWLNMSIHEGRNRQIRRMTAHVGYPTLRLIRYRIGPWYLNQLQPGQFEQRRIPAKILAQLQSTQAKSL